MAGYNKAMDTIYWCTPTLCYWGYLKHILNAIMYSIHTKWDIKHDNTLLELHGIVLFVIYEYTNLSKFSHYELQ